MRGKRGRRLTGRQGTALAGERTILLYNEPFMSKILVGMLAIALLSSATSPAVSDRWPQFRGPDAGVVADDPALPETWSATENVRWRADVAGVGWSSPIVWGDHVFVTSVEVEGETTAPKPGFYAPGAVLTTSAAVHRWMVHDFDFRTGARRWSRELHRASPPAPKHLKNSYASETPVTDGERVYVYFGHLGLFALDMTGRPVWSAAPRAGDDAQRLGHGVVAGAAWRPGVHRERPRRPVVHRRVRCRNRTAGVARESRRGDELVDAVRVGACRANGDRDGRHRSGPLIRSRRPRAVVAHRHVEHHHSDAVRARRALYLSSGYIGDSKRPTYAIRPGASGDISSSPATTTSPFIAWSSADIAPYNPTPIVYQGILYTLLDRGFFTAHDAATGQEIYGRQRITTEAGGFTASPWAYNGRLFALSEDGDTFVIQAGREFKVLGRNVLSEMTLATPAVVQDSVIIRTHSRLYRIARP